MRTIMIKKQTLNQEWTQYNIIATYKYLNLDRNEKVSDAISEIMLLLNSLEGVKKVKRGLWILFKLMSVQGAIFQRFLLNLYKCI